MPLSSALTSTIQLRALEKRVTSAIKNSAMIMDPAMQAILADDRGIGRLVGLLLGRISLLDLGASKATAVAEGSAQAGATAITPVNVAPVPTRREFARNLLDSERSRLNGLGRGEMPVAILDALVGEAWTTWANTLIFDILDLASTAAYSCGTSGAALAWAALQNGYLDMVNRGAVGPEGVLAAIKVKGVKDLAADALSLGGAIQMSQQVQQFLNIGRTGFIGEFFGGCRLYMLDDVKVVAADDVGLMLSARGLATAHEIHPLPEDSADVLVQPGGSLGWCAVEAKRDGANSAVTRIETSFWTGEAVNNTEGFEKIVYKST